MVSLRDAMDRLLAESVVRPRGGGSEGGGMASPLPVDVREQGDDFIVTAPIPGVKPENVDISVLGDMLRIHGERHDEHQEGGEGKRWLLREQRYGSFERTVRLPSAVRADKANAEFNDGILTITLPKTEEAKERRIPVQGGTSGQKAQDVPIEASSTTSGSKGQSGGASANPSGASAQSGTSNRQSSGSASGQTSQSKGQSGGSQS
jgi:HSP20 family protein